jgi:hypothetical protein
MIILVTSAFITFHFLLSQTVGKMIHNNEIGQCPLPICWEKEAGAVHKGDTVKFDYQNSITQEVVIGSKWLTGSESMGNRHSSWAVEFDKFIATSLSTSSTQYPNVFKILTWNVWFSEYKMKERMFALLTEVMLVHEADILCLQEVTNDFHGAMLQSKYISARYICVERDDVIDYDVKIWIKKEVKFLILG